jgi:GTP-binding protein
MIDLDASDELIDKTPVFYASGRAGWASATMNEKGTDLTPLLNGIVEHIRPPAVPVEPFRMVVTTLEYSEYVGRIARGRIWAGTVRPKMPVTVIRRADGTMSNGQVIEVHVFQGLGKLKVDEAHGGDIVAIVGLPAIDIGDTIADQSFAEALPSEPIDEPTITMDFQVNDSPLAGREGKYVTSRNLRDRLVRELESNVALRVDFRDGYDRFTVSGRGVLHLGVLLENMRREGYELAVSRPKVIFKEINGKRCEPLEHAVVEVPEAHAGKVIEMLGMRRGELKHMETQDGHTLLEFIIPSRGLIGVRSRMLSATNGEAQLHHTMSEWGVDRGEIFSRSRGVMVSMADGPAVGYAIWMLQERGRMMVNPGDPVYEGLIVGENAKENDLTVNCCKEKHLTNIRSAGADDAVRLVPPVKFSLEEALEYIDDDELVELTPKSIRLRKQLRSEKDRRRESRTKKVEA